jgi:hypothetical protein
MVGSGVRARPGRHARDYGTVGADSSGVWGGMARGGSYQAKRWFSTWTAAGLAGVLIDLPIPIKNARDTTLKS